ncbi:Mor transcription activator family protein [Phocoenobacter skyensis]|uniref:Mor transcription activator family protein n=1 Tax=Phocoenobacter skyensis TaxID=97481 RepID=A0ABT9JLY2_9PAST|nr:Mor transcription activator family protein [Pasteurella skyensis]MDP8079929.1 Mor transcription activator family protein [Pasteurella skyensis]MDP8085825.1 Mor transcription activator family protein [Pasteurella skyensis]
MELKGIEYSINLFVEGVGLSIDKAFEKGSTKEEMTKIFLETFCDYCGGLNFYFPKKYAKDCQNAERDRLIRKEFNGKNHRELAVKYGISLHWIYKILKNKNSN